MHTGPGCTTFEERFRQRSRAAGIVRWLAIVAVIGATLAPVARPQSAPPATSATALPIGAAAPLDAPVALRPQFVPEFAFATEALNLGRVAPGSPQRTILAGRGTVAPRAAVTIFRLWIDRLNLDGREFAGGQPFVIVDGEIQPGPQKFRSLSIDTSGYNQLPPTGHRAAPSQLIHQAIEAFLDGLFLPPRGPVAMAAPLVDLSPALQRDLARMMPYAPMARPVAPATVAGMRVHDGRLALVAALHDDLQLNLGGQPVALRLDHEILLDQETALPILVRTRISGVPNMPPLAGPVDYIVRSFVALPGMRDPIAQLATPPLPAALTDQLPPFPQRPEMPAPPKKPVAKPAPAKPAPARNAPPQETGPKPTASPAAPATSAPATSADEVAARLEALKRLLDRGLITPEQYETKQKEILGRL